MTASYVVRVVLFADEQQRIGTLIDALRFAGHVQLHRENETGSCFDILPPRAIGASLADSGEWAARTAEHFASLGYNAVKAPAWQSTRQPLCESPSVRGVCEQPYGHPGPHATASGRPLVHRDLHRCKTVDCCGDPEDVATGERLAAERAARGR